MAKGIKLDEFVTVKSKGTSCVGMMAWETPYIEFRRANSQLIYWHSENAAIAYEWLRAEQTVRLLAFLYGNRVRRVTVVASFGNLDDDEGMTIKRFGMERKNL